MVGRTLTFLYGVVCYAIFFAALVYLIGFLANFMVPKGIDAGMVTSFGLALTINIGLMLVFGLQHSVMARPGFKAAWTKIVPKPAERSTYVLFTSAALILMYWQWRPMTGVIWQADAMWLQYALWGLFALGVLIVLASTFIIDHFDLFGLRQVFLRLLGKPYTDVPFRVTFFYKFVRHPLYLGWFLTFWATPSMTVGHLLFAIGMSGYILIAVQYEERDLAKFLGQRYIDYKKRVPAFIPGLGKPHETVKARTHQSG